jgi:hypothetical protein
VPFLKDKSLKWKKEVTFGYERKHQKNLRFGKANRNRYLNLIPLPPERRGNSGSVIRHHCFPQTPFTFVERCSAFKIHFLIVEMQIPISGLPIKAARGSAIRHQCSLQIHVTF